MQEKIEITENEGQRVETRGGARKGAGRKRVADRECKISFGVSQRAKANLQAWADARGLSLREAANAIFEALGD